MQEGVNEFDVLNVHRQNVLAPKSAMALVQHWAPQCSTFSRLGERPLPEVLNRKWPVPLRSAEHPEGLPKFFEDGAGPEMKA